jgi:hypothetical protein
MPDTELLSLPYPGKIPPRLPLEKGGVGGFGFIIYLCVLCASVVKFYFLKIPSNSDVLRT